MIYNKIIKCLKFIFIVVLFATCSDDEITPRDYSRVSTLEVTNINNSGAQFNGEIIHEGNQKVIEHGFVWGTHKSPSLETSEKNILKEDITTGKFSSLISTTLDENIQYYVRAYAKDDEYLVYGKNVTFISLGSKAAIIKSIEPKIGNWGDTINISGSNFSFVTNNNHVLFKDIPSKILKSTDSTITCIVPNNIEDKSVSIHLKISNQITTAPDKFVLNSPEIFSFSPLKGTYGDLVVITGNNFSMDKNSNLVSFNGHPAEVIEANQNSLSVLVPTSINTKNNEIQVTLNLQTDIAIDPFEMLSPIIDDISPREAYINDLISIRGDNFNPDKVGDTVVFDSKIGVIIEAQKKELIVRIPSGQYINRSFPVEVKVAGQSTFSSIELTLLDPWLRKADIPYENHYRYLATGFSLNGHGYAGLGIGNGIDEPNKDFYKYDIKTNVWDRISDFAGGGRYNATSFVIGEYAYVGSGQRDFEKYDPSYDFWRYDPNSDVWTEIAELPVPASKAVGLSLNGLGYVCTTDNDNNFWRYDPNTDQWVQLPDLETISSGAKGIADAGFAIGDKLYIYAAGNSTGLHQLYEFDTNTLQWSRKADMIESGIRGGVVGMSIKNKGYIIDIYYVNEYDPISDTWKIIEEAPTPNRSNAIGFEIDDKAYFGGGNSSSFWEYTLGF